MWKRLQATNTNFIIQSTLTDTWCPILRLLTEDNQVSPWWLWTTQHCSALWAAFDSWSVSGRCWSSWEHARLHGSRISGWVVDRACRWGSILLPSLHSLGLALILFVSAALLWIQPLFCCPNLPASRPCRLADCHPGAAGVRRCGHPGGLLGGCDLALPRDPEAALPHCGCVPVHRRYRSERPFCPPARPGLTCPPPPPPPSSSYGRGVFCSCENQTLSWAHIFCGADSRGVHRPRKAAGGFAKATNKVKSVMRKKIHRLLAEHGLTLGLRPLLHASCVTQ